MGNRVLLVEGNDDEYVVRNLCAAHGREVDFAIEKTEQGSEGSGVENLLAQIPVRLKSSELERLAILVDADQDASRRWQQIRDRVRRAGFPDVPDAPERNGTVVELNDGFRTIRLGVWIMPDNTLPGMLENFAAFLVPEDERMMPHVDRFLDGIPEEERLFAEIHRPKAAIHAYLAVQR